MDENPRHHDQPERSADETRPDDAQPTESDLRQADLDQRLESIMRASPRPTPIRPNSAEHPWTGERGEAHLRFRARVGGSVRLVPDPKRLASELVRSVGELFGYDFACLSWRTPDGLEVLGSWPHEVSGHGASCEVGTRLDEYERVAIVPRGWVHCTHWPQGLTTFALLPLSDESGVRFGLMAVGSERAEELTEDDAELLRGIVEDVTDVMALARDHQMLSNAATQDPLTGLANREAFLARLSDELARAIRHGEQLSLLAWDLNKLEAVNRAHGRHAGDLALRAFADILRRETRRYDIIGRIGADEFAAVITGTNHEIAHRIADRIMQSALRTKFDGTNSLPTPSRGFSLYPEDAATLDDLVRIADWRLYGNKRERNWLVQFAEKARAKLG